MFSGSLFENIGTANFLKTVKSLCRTDLDGEKTLSSVSRRCP